MEQEIEKSWKNKEMWGEGPWQNEPDLKAFLYKSYDCCILRNDFGVLCGYVRVPKNSKFLKEEVYNTLNPHGGITYSDFDDEGEFWLGFDCGHYNDIIPINNAMKKLFSPELQAKLDELNKSIGDPLRIKKEYRTLQFVENEIMNMIDQMGKRKKITRKMERITK